MYKKLWIVFALAVAAWMLAGLPASLFLKSDDTGIAFEQVQGTVWSGTARLRLPAQSPLPVQWRWDKGLSWRWSLRSDQLTIQGMWQVNKPNRLHAIEGQINIRYLDASQWLVVIWPEGNLLLDIAYVEWSEAPQNSLLASGEVVWQQAKLAGLVNESLGDITIELSPSQEQMGHTLATIASTRQGVLDVSGDVLSDGQRYRAAVRLTPDGNRSRLLRYLQPLGRLEDGAITIERSGQLGVFQ